MRLWPKISLATKCRILFGAAVLLILGASLYLPWVRMLHLSEESEVQRALRVATAARLAAGVDGPDDWDAARAHLIRDWSRTAQLLDLPTAPLPNLLSIDQQDELERLAPRGFLLETMRRFQQDPTVEYTQKFQETDEGGQVVRLAVAVRSSEADPEPNKLRGMVHVQLPVQAESRQWSLIVVILAGLSGVFLAILVFYLVTQYVILSPVRELRGVAEQVTGGDIDVRAAIKTRDEFEDLAQAFNDMLAHLQSSHAELETINRSLDVKLEELAETNVALYESNRLKSEFIANVSHELRTPLGLIINFAELLRDTLEDPPEDKTRLVRYARNILANGRALLEIINDLLDLAKIEAGKVELHIAEFSLAETCGALIDFVRPLADKKRIELQGPATENLPQMRSDSGKVKQVLYNLLSNAIKFTPEGGRVQLKAEPADDGFVCLSVTDTGAGIPKEQYAAIFEKFRQIDSSLTREHSGTGLGLAITKELVNMLGGSINVESELDQGSTFTVRLPTEAPERIQPRLVSLND